MIEDITMTEDITTKEGIIMKNDSIMIGEKIMIRDNPQAIILIEVKLVDKVLTKDSHPEKIGLGTRDLIMEESLPIGSTSQPIIQSTS